MIVAELKLFKLLKAKIGEKEAEAFVHILETQVDEKLVDFKSQLATKEDLARVEGRLDTKISDAKAETIKWIGTLIIGLFVALVGSMAALLKIAIH